MDYTGRRGHHHHLTAYRSLQMSGRLDHPIEGHLRHRLHYKPGRLSLLLGKGYATAMIVLVSRVVVSLMGSMVVVVSFVVVSLVLVFVSLVCVVMSLMIVSRVIVSIMFMSSMFVIRVVVVVSRVIVFVHLVCMVMLVTMGLLASTGSKERRRTQAGQ